jgi:hypothetical protein
VFDLLGPGLLIQKVRLFLKCMRSDWLLIDIIMANQKLCLSRIALPFALAKPDLNDQPVSVVW